MNPYFEKSCQSRFAELRANRRLKLSQDIGEWPELGMKGGETIGVTERQQSQMEALDAMPGIQLVFNKLPLKLNFSAVSLLTYSQTWKNKCMKKFTTT